MKLSLSKLIIEKRKIKFLVKIFIEIVEIELQMGKNPRAPILLF